MIIRTLLELGGDILFSFTRSVADIYNPDNPECLSESFGYNPLQSTGLEWYCRRRGEGDELIYQEYSDENTTHADYPASSGIHARLINACTVEEDDDIQEVQQSRAMAWKQLRPSIFRTVWNSLYIGALISLLTATAVGALYIAVAYLIYKTVHNCEYRKKQLIPIKKQWMRTISDIVAAFMVYAWYFLDVLVLFRSFQLTGIKRKLVLVFCTIYCLDSAYRAAIQYLGVSHSMLTSLQKIPLNVLSVISVTIQAFILAKHFCSTPRKKQFIFFLQLMVPFVFPFTVAFVVVYLVYPAYNRQNENGQLLIALFVPLIVVLLKATTRICAQRVWNIIHPGTSFVLLAPLYCGSAVMFRILQVDLETLGSIAILGVIHGVVEVIERSTMVLRDHIYHQICERKSAPWGSFRTPRRERLAADIAIMSMVFESSALVSINGFLYLYKLIYLKDSSLLELLQPFAISTSVPLVIEWFFTSLSLAIETRYQNMPVMAVWRRRWRRHILVAIINALPFAIWGTTNLLIIVHGRFSDTSNHSCKMPFT